MRIGSGLRPFRRDETASKTLRRRSSVWRLRSRWQESERGCDVIFAGAQLATSAIARLPYLPNRYWLAFLTGIRIFTSTVNRSSVLSRSIIESCLATASERLSMCYAAFHPELLIEGH